MQLIGLGLKKIFSMDDKPFEEEMFQPLNELYKTKQEQVMNFWGELLDLPFYVDLKAPLPQVIEMVFAPRP